MASSELLRYRRWVNRISVRAMTSRTALGFSVSSLIPANPSSQLLSSAT